jgi:C-terminal processing protease CtpA/Prc
VRILTFKARVLLVKMCVVGHEHTASASEILAGALKDNCR